MKQQVGVWSGVKIGCGIFIVLPLILIAGIFVMIFTSPTCSAIKKQQERVQKQQNKEKSPQ